MSLISAFEDLQQTTLKAVPGMLRKLEYLSGLRDSEGGYAHWGLTRVYGDLAAGRALAQAHRALLAKVLAMPIRNLVEDAEQSSKMAGVPASAYVERLSNTGVGLLPPGPGAGSARHLNSVLHALSSLIRSRTRKRDANLPT
jgi:hypothetical protein